VLIYNLVNDSANAPQLLIELIRLFDKRGAVIDESFLFLTQVKDNLELVPNLPP